MEQAIRGAAELGHTGWPYRLSPVARGLMAYGFRRRVKLGLGHSGTALAAFFHLPAGAEVGQQRHRKRQKGGASGRASRSP